MIRKLAHLCLVTDQLQPMLEFYTNKIGFKIQFIFRNKENEIFGYYLNCGDSTFLEIFDRIGKHKQWGKGEVEPLTGGIKMNHMCFEVTGLKEFRDGLESRGVKIGQVHSGMDHSLQAWTGDPDGNAIEFMEYTHASWQLNPPVDVS